MFPSTGRRPFRGALSLLAAGWLCLLLPFGAGGDVLAATSLALHSEAGDYVGGGLDYFYTTSQGSFSVTRNARNGVTVTFRTPSNLTWTMAFAAPGNVPLSRGVWLDASSFADASGGAGLTVSGLGRSCSASRGNFQIKQVTYGSTGQVLSFWALFAQNCDDASATLCGDIRFNSNLPVSVTAPAGLSVLRGNETFFDVNGAATSGGPPSLTASGLPPGANFDDYGDGTGGFNWFTAPDQVGTWIVTFYATSAAGAVDSAVSLINVTGLSSLRVESEPGDPVGGGMNSQYDGTEAAFDVWNDNGAVVASVLVPGGDSWSLRFATPDRVPATGSWSGAGPEPGSPPGQPALAVSRNGVSCSDLTGEFEIRELLIAGDGAIQSFRVVFEQACAGAGASLRGELRYNASAALEVTAPFGLTADAGTTLVYHVLASDLYFNPVTLTVQDLPAGAAFVDHGDNSGTLTWTPAANQLGEHDVTIHGDNGQGLTDYARTTIRVTGTPVVEPPAADAGGPYAAETGAPIQFDGAGSTDPAGLPLMYAWSFGDGGSATGVTAAHSYAAAGTYSVVLTVCNSDSCASDTALAVVTDPAPPDPPDPPADVTARGFAAPGNNPVRLNSSRPRYSMILEPMNASFALADVDLNSFRLVSDDTGLFSGVSAVVAGPSPGGDRDDNGMPDLEATFDASDLRALFHSSGMYAVRLEARLQNGVPVVAPFTLEVVSGAIELKRRSEGTSGPEIRFSLTVSGPVNVRLYDAAGRQVATLLDGMHLQAGDYSIPADRGSSSRTLVPGVYFYRVDAVGVRLGGKVFINR